MITKLRKDGSYEEFFAYPFLTEVDSAKATGWAGYMAAVPTYANVTASQPEYRVRFNIAFTEALTTAQARQVIEALQACIAYAEKEHHADAS